MAKVKQLLASPITTLALFILAVVLLAVSTVGGARAALAIQSQYYSAGVEMYDIGVTLVENGADVSYRDYVQNSNGLWDEHTGVLLGNMLAEGEDLKPGKSYPEAIAVKNSGAIDEYVRVSLYKYWLDSEGKKVQDLSPDLIDLNVLTGNGWVADSSAVTPERTVLYYTSILPATDSDGNALEEDDARRITPACTDTLTIDGSIAQAVNQESSVEVRDGVTFTTITTTYAYDGYMFQIEAQVDAVQTHNAADAMKSAWGIDPWFLS